MKNFNIFSSFTFLLCAELACSNSGTFSGSAKSVNPAASNSVTPTSVNSAPELKNITEQFDFAAEQSTKADVVWVIDNSGSMAEEAGNVRKNFETFLTTVGAVRDLKTALVSSSGTTGTLMAFPEKFQGQENYYHFKRRVGSTDALTIAAKLSCKAIGMGPYKTCANSALEAIQTETATYTSIEDLQAGEAPKNGMLVSFFREDARRIYVIVTDDNAKGVDETNFIKFLKFEAPADFKPVVYAFRANKNEAQSPNCMGAQDGIAYDALAKESGGKVYSVCDEDWTKSFKELSDAIINISGASFSLQHQEISEVTKVTINGLVTSKEKYTVASGQLTFNEGVLPIGKSKIEISYKSK